MNARTIQEATWRFAQGKLREDWSPEQISNHAAISMKLCTNGLIRQYFPKGMDFNTIAQQEIEYVMKRLNNRSRKRLGYQTPAQVFFMSGVALHP